ncbi:hypothetical protein HBB16_20490 [Pseudonocardia sp. MCCB 268]|nr:hypothetical protein [Pseudonocardia cytotoxica]
MPPAEPSRSGSRPSSRSLLPDLQPGLRRAPRRRHRDPGPGCRGHPVARVLTWPDARRTSEAGGKPFRDAAASKARRATCTWDGVSSCSRPGPVLLGTALPIDEGTAVLRPAPCRRAGPRCCRFRL